MNKLSSRRVVLLFLRRTPPLTEPAVRISRNGLFVHIHSSVAVIRRSSVATNYPIGVGFMSPFAFAYER